ncbi:MAG: ABC transporter substrate-binding protein [Microcystaceae cyanobacterium]
MAQKNDSVILILSLFLTFGILVGGYWLLKSRIFPEGKEEVIPSVNSGQTVSSDLGQSMGQRQLIALDTTPQKIAGIQAFAQGNYREAINYWQVSLKVNRNDPETLIYLNNALAQAHNPLKIAVVVPLGKSENIAKEILRGVAQRQQEINQQGGLNGRYLQVLIVNDDNDPQKAAEVAQKLVNDSSILAVVGHNSSDATLGAAPHYQKGGLVMISPTSTANKVASQGNYIFRTVPSVRFEANALSRYAVNQARKTKMTVCYDSQAQYTLAFKEDFTSAILTDGGQVTNINCDLSAPNFQALEIIAQSQEQGADSILLIPSVDRISPAISVGQANQKQLALFGSSTLYTFETLDKGQNFMEGIVITIPWYPTAIADHSFAEDAINLWGGAVNWRTALSYDATQTLITGLNQKNSRSGLQQTLADPNFNSQGASGQIRFLPSGDRQSAPLFVKVVSQPQGDNKTGFDFVLLSPNN